MALTLELTYPEMAQIRELVTKHMMDGLPDVSADAEIEVIQKVVELRRTERNPFTHLGRSNLILDKIQAIDDEIKEALNKGGDGR